MYTSNENLTFPWDRIVESSQRPYNNFGTDILFYIRWIVEQEHLITSVNKSWEPMHYETVRKQKIHNMNL